MMSNILVQCTDFILSNRVIQIFLDKLKKFLVKGIGVDEIISGELTNLSVIMEKYHKKEI